MVAIGSLKGRHAVLLLAFTPNCGPIQSWLLEALFFVQLEFAQVTLAERSTNFPGSGRERLRSG